jgi:iron(III)-enterobactin esterase
MRDDMHDRVVANEGMAKVLAAKRYHYQFVFARNADMSIEQSNSRLFPMPLSTCGRIIIPPR